MRTVKDFIQGEILAYQTDIVNHLLNSDSFNLSWEEDVNAPEVFDYEGDTYTRNELLEKIEELEDENFGSQSEEIDCIKDILDEGPNNTKPTNWILVTEAFYTNLKERNEITVSFGTSYWWGRLTGNSAAYEDAVCIHIANDFGITQ